MIKLKFPKVLDNKKNKVVDELKGELKKGSKLSIVSAYFPYMHTKQD